MMPRPLEANSDRTVQISEEFVGGTNDPQDSSSTTTFNHSHSLAPETPCGPGATDYGLMAGFLRSASWRAWNTLMMPMQTHWITVGLLRMH